MARRSEHHGGKKEGERWGTSHTQERMEGSLENKDVRITQSAL